MTIRYSRDAAKAIERMDRPLKARIRRAIEGLTRVPPEGDIKPMQGVGDGRYRVRVGAYRIVYRIDRTQDDPALLILDIGSRGDIYK